MEIKAIILGVSHLIWTFIKIILFVLHDGLTLVMLLIGITYIDTQLYRRINNFLMWSN